VSEGELPAYAAQSSALRGERLSAILETDE